mgnify:CR=1 FL=1
MIRVKLKLKFSSQEKQKGELSNSRDTERRVIQAKKNRKESCPIKEKQKGELSKPREIERRVVQLKRNRKEGCPSQEKQK